MRLAVLLLMMLAGCGERSFDQRYDETQTELENRARNLDAAVNASANEIDKP